MNGRDTVIDSRLLPNFSANHLIVNEKPTTALMYHGVLEVPNSSFGMYMSSIGWCKRLCRVDPDFILSSVFGFDGDFPVVSFV